MLYMKVALDTKGTTKAKHVRISFWSLMVGVTMSATLNGGAEDTNRPDILGIQLGIPVMEAYDRLKSYDPNLRVEVAESVFSGLGSGFIVNTLVVTRPAPPEWRDNLPAEIVTVGFTLPPNKQAVWKVARAVRFPEGGEVAKGSLVGALRQKYGNETLLLEGGSAVKLYWIRDASGQPVDEQTARQCANFFGNEGGFQAPSLARRDIRVYAAGVENRVFFPPRQAPTPQPCQELTYILAELRPAENPELIAQMMTVIVDAGLDARTMDATRAVVKGATEQQEKDKLEKAQQQEMPKL